jgi:DNA helicase IV
MTATPNPKPEPTLSDAIEQITSQIKDLSDKVDKFDERFLEETKRSDEQFADYRQATQWVVQLAFTLIASATITVIITSIFK